MKSLTKETYQLIDELYLPPALLSRMWAQGDAWESILEKVENSAEPLAAQHLIPFILQNQNSAGLAAAGVVQRLLAPLPFTDLLELDEQTRAWYALDRSRWTRIPLAQIENLHFFQPFQAALLGMCSFHGNGYIREKAVRELANVCSGEEIPYLAIRMGDWVDEVRDVAVYALKARLQPENAMIFVKLLPLIERLSRRARVIESSALDLLAGMFGLEGSRPALLAGLQSEDRTTRRICYPVALSAQGDNLVEAISLATQNKDILVRAWSVQKVKDVPDARQAASLLAIFRKDTCSRVRWEALSISLDRFPEQALDLLSVALLDPNNLIRSGARHQINQLGGMDFAGFYRDAIAKRHALDFALCGLGETGTAEDDDTILPFVHHPRARVRRAALNALARLNPKRHISLFHESLSDPSSGVSLEALRALSQNPASLSPARLWEIMRFAKQEHTRLHLVSLMTYLSKWESLYYLLSTCVDKDEAVARAAQREIHTWLQRFNRSYVVPSIEQKLRAMTALILSSNNLNPKVFREVQIILDCV
jgi:HEAT repeat protein